MFVFMSNASLSEDTDRRPKKLRSAVTNGKRRYVEGDGRSAWDRRRRDIELEYLDDMGGELHLSGYQRGLAQVAATLRVELERLEGQLSMGQTVDLDAYARVAGHYRRICESLGIERKQRDVTPSLESYLAAKKAAAE